MMERKTHKMMDVGDKGKRFVCIYKTEDKITPYRLYEVYCEFGQYGTTERRKQIAKYTDMKSVLYHVYTLF